MNTDPATSSSAKVIIRRGLNREDQEFIGITSTRLASNADDPTRPCCVGERPSSLEISGSISPIKKSMDIDVEMPEAMPPITTHRYRGMASSWAVPKRRVSEDVAAMLLAAIISGG